MNRQPRSSWPVRSSPSPAVAGGGAETAAERAASSPTLRHADGGEPAALADDTGDPGTTVVGTAEEVANRTGRT